jgi:hypothetical protein
MINIEYCHITPNLNADAEIDKANTSIKLLDILKQDGPHQFSLFIDDLYDSLVTDSMIEGWVARLHIKPDIVFSEKSLHSIAQILVSKIDPSKVQIRENVR